MKKILIILLSVFIWYIIGVFISNEFNPLNWWITGKIAFIIVLLSVISNLDDIL